MLQIISEDHDGIVHHWKADVPFCYFSREKLFLMKPTKQRTKKAILPVIYKRSLENDLVF